VLHLFFSFYVCIANYRLEGIVTQK
jgi:hypothetical protein